MAVEKVNHPSHYAGEQKGKRKGKECIVEMRDNYGDANVAIFCLLNAYKYLFRAGKKRGSSYSEDIAKAQWYYDYAENMGCPIVDMNYWTLKTDVENKLKCLK